MPSYIPRLYIPLTRSYKRVCGVVTVKTTMHPSHATNSIHDSMVLPRTIIQSYISQYLILKTLSEIMSNVNTPICMVCIQILHAICSVIKSNRYIWCVFKRVTTICSTPPPDFNLLNDNIYGEIMGLTFDKKCETVHYIFLSGGEYLLTNFFSVFRKVNAIY